jgi:hypothetical protein
MAHFAELESKTDPTGFTSDTHLVVKRVIVVGNDIEANGGTLEDNDMHADGETWCVNFFGGGTWKQTSYNHNFRKQYAGIGYVYNASKNKFLAPQPYASWALDGSDDWQAPITYPSVKKHLHGIIIFHGMKQNITLTTIEVGKQLNQTTTRKPKQSIIGMAQLGFLNRRLKWPELMAV